MFMRFIRQPILKKVTRNQSVMLPHRAINFFSTGSYLTSKQPHKIHSEGYLKLQRQALENRFNQDSFSVVKINKGQTFLAPNSDLNSIYGGVTLYEKFPQDMAQFNAAKESLGAKWVEYRVIKDIFCIKRESKNGDICIYGHYKFLEVANKNINQPEIENKECAESSNLSFKVSKSKD